MAANHKVFEPRHNVVAFVDGSIPEAAPYLQMIEFLQRSRIFQAITLSAPIYSGQIADFWDHAEYDEAVDPPRIVTTVSGRQLIISEETVRAVLGFGADAGERTLFPVSLIHGCLRRMGYTGAPPAQYDKGDFGPQWRYLMHILIVCLSARKSGFTGFGHSLASGLIALTLNKPFNFSGYIFNNMVSNAQHPRKFFMYPRFVQLFINHLLPAVRARGELLQLSGMSKRILTDCQSHRSSVNVVAPFGHIVDASYVAPLEDGWDDVPQLPYESVPADPPAEDPPALRRSLRQARDQGKRVLEEDMDPDYPPEDLPPKRRHPATRSTPTAPEPSTSVPPASSSAEPVVTFRMFTEFAGSISELNSTVNDHAHHIEQCHKAITAQFTNLSNLKAKVDYQASTISALEQRVSALEAENETLRVDSALHGGMKSGPSEPENEEANPPQQSEEDQVEEKEAEPSNPANQDEGEEEDKEEEKWWENIVKYSVKPRRSQRIANNQGRIKPGPGLTEEDSIIIE